MQLKTKARRKRPNVFKEKLTPGFSVRVVQAVLTSIMYMVSFLTSARELIFSHTSGWTEFKMSSQCF